MALKAQTRDDMRFLTAIHGVRDMLATGAIKSREFDMSAFHALFRKKRGEGTCGTAHCIGGWVDLLLNNDGRNDPRASLDLSPKIRDYSYALFYNFNYGHGVDRKSAVEAIDRFLAGNSNPWNYR